VISNTTEAGIAFDESAMPGDRPPLGFPAKVAAFLYERYLFFNGDLRRGLVFLPCELIDNNGQALRKCVMRHAEKWGYGPEFMNWADQACLFADTLVDRIVSGFPAAEAESLYSELGYEDTLLNTGELFHFWAIRAHSPKAAQPPANAQALPVFNLPELLPFHKIGLNVLYTDDVESYAARKVRLLNGPHTALSSAAYPAGFDFVGDAINDQLFHKYIRAAMYDEIIPTLTQGLKVSELESFAASVLDRFANPYIKHRLSAIMLNATSKFRVRILPSILEYYRINGVLPKALTYSFAALIAYYRIVSKDSAGNAANPAYYGSRQIDGVMDNYQIIDDSRVLDFFHKEWQTFDNSYGIKSDNSFGTISNNSFGTSSNNSFGSASDNSFGTAYDNSFGSASDNSFGTASNNSVNQIINTAPGEAFEPANETLRSGILCNNMHILVHHVLANNDIWGSDLNEVLGIPDLSGLPGLAETVGAHLANIIRTGTASALETAIS
jgi:tagaturonate reductase